MYEKDFSKLAVSTDFYPAYASLAKEEKGVGVGCGLAGFALVQSSCYST